MWHDVPHDGARHRWRCAHFIIVAKANSEWKPRMETANGNGEWKRRQHNGDWKERLRAMPLPVGVLPLRASVGVSSRSFYSPFPLAVSTRRFHSQFPLALSIRSFPCTIITTIQ